ncbi:PD40 domain-containing protein [Streptacidiphilus sp. P02-A3a]|uniref:TolB family protein n=1 Tax=Streptacidiphilus sp. P02-A3a TaxID=2704468 RepID=UPI0015F85CD2|nr:PD40 domain-containing protein [Streptacidiphilus sp. P02-A3a]QMU67017.1 hypothetical protein GXP74_01120 [Streptacidiphilus sp. P02-A3a]
MSTRKRRSTASAIALAAAVTTGATLLLTGCGPTTPAPVSSSAAATVPASAPPSSPSGANPPAASGSAAPSARPSASATGGGAAPVPNGTGGSGLTISDGTDYVVMNGTRVDFGTVVRDLSWNPAGTRAAFIDGSGNLVVADPDGSGRTVVAHNPGDQVWSHPAWQVMPYDSRDQLPAKDNIIFADSVNGVSRLVAVPATGGTPAPITLNADFGSGVPPLPQTGNTWPNTGGVHGTAVYTNTGTGEVYLRDDFLRQMGSPQTPGSEPALAPDESEIVFVRSVAGHDHLFELSLQAQHPAPKDLTPTADTDYTEPAWSPDGRTIAARTPAGIVTLAADGTGAPVLVAPSTGLPAYRG